MVRMCKLMTFACATIMAAGSVASADKVVAQDQLAADAVASVPGSARAYAKTITVDASTLGLGGGCDCTWANGNFDQRDGQISHLGGAVQYGAKAADDFYLCPGYVYDLDTITVTLLTTSIQQLTKANLELYADCNGMPGELLHTFTKSSVVETGTAFGVDAAGTPIRIVNVTFSPNLEPATVGTGLNVQPNPIRNIVLKGGTYWISAFGLTDGQCPGMNMCDVTYWGTAGGGTVIKGSVAKKINGVPTAMWNQFSFPGMWSSVEDCCVGCTDLAFTVCARACKILIDNGVADRVSVPAGSTSQFAPFTQFDSRSADDFVVPPCDPVTLCYIEGTVYTNCIGFRGGLELYANDCRIPSYALAGTTGTGTAIASREATKIVDLGFNVTIDGRSLRAYRLEFHDVGITLAGGNQYWLSLGVVHTFSLQERAYFAFNADCARSCLIRFNPGHVLVKPVGMPMPPQWTSVGRDFSFLIATELAPVAPLPGNSNAGCATDFDGNGTSNIDDIFNFLNAWFTGCP